MLHCGCFLFVTGKRREKEIDKDKKRIQNLLTIRAQGTSGRSPSDGIWTFKEFSMLNNQSLKQNNSHFFENEYYLGGATTSRKKACTVLMYVCSSRTCFKAFCGKCHQSNLARQSNKKTNGARNNSKTKLKIPIQ